MSVNKVMLLGRLGSDVEIKNFEGGNCIGNFSLATSESYTNKNTGEKVTNTEWHKVVARNKTAEIMEKYLKKGDQVFLEGKVKTRSWDVEGGKRYQTEVIVDRFSFVGSSSNSSQGQTHTAEVITTQNEDDLPF